MTDHRRACPNCLSLRSPEEQVCGDCAQALAWIDSFSSLRDALTEGSNRAWRAELQLTVGWEDGETSVVRAEPGSFELAAGPAGTLRLELDGPLRRLTVKRRGGPQVLALPGRTRLETVDVETRLQAVPVGQANVSAITAFRPGAVTVDEIRGKVFGKLAACDVQLAADAVSLKHCLVIKQPGSGGDAGQERYWIVDLGSHTGTFVNRRRVICAPLTGADLVQVGPFAWTFYSSEGLLVPAAPIKGVPLSLKEVTVGQRLGPIGLEVERGQLVAVVGRSGSGKSTLLKTIVGAPGFRDRGTVLADGRNTSDESKWFRSILGYVSQESVIHDDLLARQALWFNAKLRGEADAAAQIDTVLQQVDLSRDRWAAPPGALSGGQRKRLQTAAELITGPRFLLLDEPTSGLDPQRERSLLKLLRNLGHRGCTVVVVTHSLSRLELFDRVLLIDQGRVLFDGAPSELAEKIPSGNLDEMDPRAFEAEPLRPAPTRPPALGLVGSVARAVCDTARRRWAELARRRPGRLGDWARTNLQQFALLFRREWTRLENRALRRTLPLIGIPLLFAVALHLAVPAVKLEWLGFFSLLTCIWLGASLSLLAVADEREVFDHQRLLFLRVGPYLAAKTLFYWLLSAFQTAWFFLPMALLRERTVNPHDMLHGWGRALVCLVCVGWASVGMGLVISALVGRNRQLATAILPLVMMVQIVFSAQVCGDGSSLDRAYRHLHFRACQGKVCPLEEEGGKQENIGEKREDAGRQTESPPSPERCPLYAERLVTFKDGSAFWLCERCEMAFGDVEEHLNSQDRGAELREVVRPQVRREVEEQRNKRCSPFAVLATYLTVSRYGDIALRSFAYSKDDHECLSYAVWRHKALAVLLLLAAGLPVLAGLILVVQSSAAWEHLTWWSRRLGRRHDEAAVVD